MTTEKKKTLSNILLGCSSGIIAILIFALTKSEEKGVVKEKTNNNAQVIQQYKIETDKKFDKVIDAISDIDKKVDFQIITQNNNFINLQNTIIESRK